MTEDETHEGWANYETWLVKLWLDNEEWAYKTVVELVPRWASEGLAKARLLFGPNDECVVPAMGEYHAGAQLKEWVIEMFCPSDTSGMTVDLLSHALDRVAWVDIARDYLDEVEWLRIPREGVGGE